MRFSFLASLALLPSLCFAWVFGPDPRIPMPTDKLPWAAVGRLVNKTSDSDCTATLVEKDLILTAGHCFQKIVELEVVDHGVSLGKRKFQSDLNGDLRNEEIYFIPSGFASHRLSAKVIEVIKSPRYINPLLLRPENDLSSEDYAFARLEQPIGATIGFVKIAPI